MKKNLFTMAIVAIMCLMAPQGAQAQSLFQKLGGMLGSQATETVGDKAGSGVAGLLDNLLGTIGLKTDSLQGTWEYSKPCVAFESENVLTKVGGTVASGKIEASLKKMLDKVGFTEGRVSLTFNADSTGVISCGDRNVDVQWKLEGTDLTITFPVTQRSIQMNAKITGGTLQVAMNADKLLTLVNAVTEKGAGLGTTMGTINSMMKNVKGMYLGLKYTRKK